MAAGGTDVCAKVAASKKGPKAFRPFLGRVACVSGDERIKSSWKSPSEGNCTVGGCPSRKLWSGPKEWRRTAATCHGRAYGCYDESPLSSAGAKGAQGRVNPETGRYTFGPSALTDPEAIGTARKVVQQIVKWSGVTWGTENCESGRNPQNKFEGRRCELLANWHIIGGTESHRNNGWKHIR